MLTSDPTPLFEAQIDASLQRAADLTENTCRTLEQYKALRADSPTAIVDDCEQELLQIADTLSQTRFAVIQWASSNSRTATPRTQNPVFFASINSDPGTTRSKQSLYNQLATASSVIDDHIAVIRRTRMFVLPSPT